MECCGAVGDLTCGLGCVNFCQAVDDLTLCECGHKKFRHRVVDSDRGVLEQLKGLIMSTAVKIEATNEKFDATNGKIDATNEKLDATNGKIEATNGKIQALSSAMGYLVEDILDPWCGIRTNDGSDASGQGKNTTRTTSILNFYRIDKDVCMVLGKCDLDESQDKGRKDRVMNAHLWPNHTQGRGLNILQLNTEDVNDARNFLRLHKSLEHAFDRHEIIFLFVPNSASLLCDSTVPAADSGSTEFRLQVRVLDPTLLASTEKRVVVSTSPEKSLSWAEINNIESVWVFGGRNPKPFTRILAQHAHSSIIRAEQYGWIQQDVVTEYRDRALQLLRISLQNMRGFGMESL